MKTWMRILSLVLALLLSLTALVACGDNDDTEGGKTDGGSTDGGTTDGGSGNGGSGVGDRDNNFNIGDLLS